MCRCYQDRKSVVYVPQRAEPAESRKAYSRRAKPFGDVSGHIHTKEVERNSLLPGSAKRRQSMAGLLPSNTKAPAKDLDIVSCRLGRLKKLRVRHHHCGGEVASEGNATQPPRSF